MWHDLCGIQALNLFKNETHHVIHGHAMFRILSALLYILYSENVILFEFWSRLRVSIHVSFKMHWVNIWLRKKSCLLSVGPTINCVWNAGRWKAANCCFLARLEMQPCYTVHWTVEHWIVELCSTIPARLGPIQRAKCIEPRKIYIFYFLIVFYLLDDVVFAEFDKNSNLFLIIFYKLCCCVLKKLRKLSEIFQTWWNYRQFNEIIKKYFI